jgi:hypothetical protein
MKKIYTEKQISSYKNFKKNVLGRGNVAKILDSKREQGEFRQALMEKKKGGVTVREMREVIGSFHHKTTDHIDKGETRRLANEYIGGSRFMLNSKGEEKDGKRTSNFNREQTNRGSQLSGNSGQGGISRTKPIGFSGIKLVR